eukprot:9482623-Pyramimonas_sp.AAC.1
MTAEEILLAHCERSCWPVPEALSLDEWIDQIKAEKRPVHAVEASAEVQCIVVEVLGDSHPSGHGLTARMESLRAS